MTIPTKPDIHTGTSIGTFTRTTGLETWNRYAAVNYEFVPIHMDDEAGKAAGMGGAFGPGNLLISYLHVLVREWAGDAGRLSSLTAQFRKPNTKGEITVGGTVTNVSEEPTGTRVELELWVRDAQDAILAPGTAVVVF